MLNKQIARLMLAAIFTAIISIAAAAQATTSEIVGTITDAQGQPVTGASIEATHVPTGTVYNTETNDSGRYALPAMRVGGPYTLKVEAAGFKEQTRENLQLALGTASTQNFNMSTAIDVEVTVTNDAIFSEVRTGAATTVPQTAIQSMPTISRQLSDFTRLTPQAGANNSFAGQDNRLNNITVDGSYFNNSFGLAGAPGERTNVSPISLDAIEELQVNVSPFDVRQGNFVGASLNAVTKGGTNQYNGSIYYMYRKPGLVGNQAGPNPFDRGAAKYKNYGFRVGGPLPFFNFGDDGGPMFISGKNKLFFFFSYETEELSQPATNFRARNAGEAVGGNVTRVLSSDLTALSNYLRTNFGYETGPFQDYPSLTPADKWLGRVDYNIDSNNRLSMRYTRLDSNTDVLLSNSSSLGQGTRRSNLFGLNFQNSNYKILENIRSFVGEWNSTWGSSMSNSLLMGYTTQDESRESLGEFFPMVDILEAGSVYTTFGFEPFTPNNELRYKSFQLQDNVTFYRGSHTLSGGISFEKYESENVFFPGSQSVYVYNSLADFYADANGFLANPNRTVGTVSHRFQVRWSNVPGLEKPIQPLKVKYVGFYGQDNWKIRDNLSMTYGVRVDVPFFGKTGFTNAQANALNFRDENGNTVKYQTEKLPNANLLWSPRVGFNFSPFESGRVQVRGGTGVFTARPAYVWISNQIGENGILTGFENVATGVTRPFHPSPNRYKPTTVTGAPAASYALALTDPNFKFPQIWRSSIGTDFRVPFGLIAGGEFIWSKDLNGVYYTNDNLAPFNSAFVGADNRPRFTTTAANRLNANIENAIVLKNQSLGKQFNVSFTLERPFRNGLYVKGAYSYGEARNTVDPGSIASGSWQNNPHSGDPNNPGIGISSANQGHRLFGVVSYSREYFKFGGTTVSMFWERRTGGNGSYLFSADMNNDGGINDLIYIPRDASEMNFEQFCVTSTGANATCNTPTAAVTFTPAQQAAAWEGYIQQDRYLRGNRGNFSRRGAVFLPFVTRADLSVAQDLFFKIKGQTQKFQIRADILNVGNLFNSDWGIGQTFTSLQPLIPAASRVDGQGRALYRLRNLGTSLIQNTFIPTAGTADVYRIQIGFRYIFNK